MGRGVIMLLGFLFVVSCKQKVDHELRDKDFVSVSSSSKSGEGEEFKPTDELELEFENVDTTDMESLEKRIAGQGLIDVEELIPSIQVDLKYTTDDNFLNKDVYGSLERCYLQPEVARQLKLAQLFLKSKYPDYSLIVFDGVRPQKVQWIMWNSIEGDPAEKDDFLAHPRYGSLHNYGAAVDVSIVDQYGDPLDMGTSFDHRGELAYPSKEEELLRAGELTKEQIENRHLLRKVMTSSGFHGIRTEWWHFSTCSRREASRKFGLVK